MLRWTLFFHLPPVCEKISRSISITSACQWRDWRRNYLLKEMTPTTQSISNPLQHSSEHSILWEADQNSRVKRQSSQVEGDREDERCHCCAFFDISDRCNLQSLQGSSSSSAVSSSIFFFGPRTGPDKS